MQIVLKKQVTSVNTVHSPYYDEIGKHETTSTYACCGKCGRSVEQARYYKYWNFCPYCGEKIDWIIEDEVSNG